MKKLFVLFAVSFVLISVTTAVVTVDVTESHKVPPFLSVILVLVTLASCMATGVVAIELKHRMYRDDGATDVPRGADIADDDEHPSDGESIAQQIMKELD